jgi:hypothetical protein
MAVGDSASTAIQLAYEQSFPPLEDSMAKKNNIVAIILIEPLFDALKQFSKN